MILECVLERSFLDCLFALICNSNRNAVFWNVSGGIKTWSGTYWNTNEHGCKPFYSPFNTHFVPLNEKVKVLLKYRILDYGPRKWETP